MFRAAISVLSLVVTAPLLSAAQEEYVNYGIVTNEQVDAVNFINNGEFWVETFQVPWSSRNTRSFINNGVIGGSVGQRFEHVSNAGLRTRAESFLNTGTIFNSDGGGFSGLIGGDFVGSFASDSSYAIVNANTIQNPGDISVGPGGLIRVTGDTVDLSGGTLVVEPIGTGSFFGSFGGFLFSDNSFIPDEGLYDLAWGIDVNTNMNVGGIILGVNPTIINTPNFRITNETFRCIDSLFLTNASTWVLTTTVNETNINIQVVAVQTTDTNIFTDVRFIETTFPNFEPPQGGFLSPVVEFTSPATNIITFRQFTNTLYLIDQIASSTNNSLSDNLVAPTFRPGPLVLSRFTPFDFFTGVTSNDVISEDIFNSPIYSNRVVTNFYAAYAAQVESSVARVPNLPDVGVTNHPGRVEITADDIDLTNTRIRGEGLVSITTSNLVSSENATVDVARLKYNLGKTANFPGEAPTLQLKDLARGEVQRFGGPLSAFTTVWTNMIAPLDTNLGPIEVRFTLLVVDASQLKTRTTVTTHELALRAAGSGQVVIDDDLTVANRLSIDAQHVTLNGRLSLDRGLRWSPTNFVRLQNLTNNGFLQLSDVADYQQNGGAPLANFVNRGTAMSFSHLINADYFENTGGIISTQFFRQSFTNTCLGTVFFITNSSSSIGVINVRANTAKLDNGFFTTGGDVRLAGNIYKISRHGISAGGTLFMDVGDTLTDIGSLSQNTWEVGDGFQMSRRPQGDLLGTRIISHAAEFDIVNNTWASSDVGATPQGFSNNVALGALELRGNLFSRYNFRPGTAGSALYVDLLEINGTQADLATLTNTVRLLGMNIYYADIVSTNPAINAESLNGLQLGTGRLIWVPDFVGPNTFIDVALSPTGPTIQVNRALRDSPTIDSDGDGIANRYDDFPFTPGITFRIGTPELTTDGSKLSFIFGAKANSSYVIEYTTNLKNPQWEVLQQNLQSGSSGGSITFTDQVTANSSQRYYRVRIVQ